MIVPKKTLLESQDLGKKLNIEVKKYIKQNKVRDLFIAKSCIGKTVALQFREH